MTTKRTPQPQPQNPQPLFTDTFRLRLVGVIADNPVLRKLEKGGQVYNFTVAVAMQVGQFQTTTQWFRISCWDSLAAFLSQGPGLQKGQRVTVLARSIKAQPYVSKRDGKQYASLEVTAESVTLMQMPTE